MTPNGPSQRLQVVPKRDATAAPPAPPTSDLKQLLVDNLAVVEGVIAFVCHRHRMAADDADEFAAEVKLRLVDRDYEILRRFQHRSSLRTYLTVVIQRLFLDYRDRQWGKWRPSAEARRLGPIAMRLEMLTVRDGIGLEQACETLHTNERITLTRADLESIAARLPRRVRRMRVGEEVLESLPHHDTAPDVQGLEAAADDAGRRIRHAVTRAMESLGDQDRLILRLKFQNDLSIADIARALHLEQKPLYRRMDALMSVLREAIESEGISRETAQDVVDRGNLDLGVALSTPSVVAPAPLK